MSRPTFPEGNPGREAAPGKAEPLRSSLLLAIAPKFILVGADLAALIASFIGALLLRFDGAPSGEIWSYSAEFHLSLLIGLAAYVAAFYRLRLYRYAWRFAGLETLRSVALGCSLGLLAWIAIQIFTEQGRTLPRSVLIIHWLLSILLVGGIRLLLRIIRTSQAYGWRGFRFLPRTDVAARRVVIVGADTAGERLLRVLTQECEELYQVIGFLDDTRRPGLYIHHAPILGPLSHLEHLIATDAIDEVMVATADLKAANVRECVMLCRQRAVPVRAVPSIHGVIDGREEVRLTEISLEDLLRRPPVRSNIREIGRYLSGKRVLVTGAGGSIGSELCRQICALNPEALILFGHGENSIDRIHRELLHRYPGIRDRVHMAIGSIAGPERLASVFSAHRPHVVFHAAAHKHVPIMELNVAEAVQNNVFGTRNLASTAVQHGVERFVGISTDKAVYPSSVMGATKWLCEQVVRAAGQEAAETTFVSVRFGNVLGSRGSVVPIFQEQISRGGPVTVTHPEMTRYFMTIPEAVQLVLQAGAIGAQGDLFILDMGEPVRIVDLARDLIRFAGCTPGEDIGITFTGLRPGERLHESLLMDEEEAEPAEREGLLRVRRRYGMSPDELRQVLSELRARIDRDDQDALLRYITEVVPVSGNGHLAPGPTLASIHALSASPSAARPEPTPASS